MINGGKNFAILTIAGLLLFGCQSSIRFSSSKTTKNDKESIKTGPRDNQDYSPNPDYSDLSDIRKNILRKAESLIGTPYCYGGYSSSCMDCSGFVKTVYESAGIDLPRVSKDMYQKGMPVNGRNAKPGDLVFFADSKGINHVGIYAGNNQMIHSSTSNGVIRQSLSDKYFANNLAGYRKILSIN
jgi:cell wall-associated NlpC family hydrolase